ncbi:MAG: LruC domain-containing protein [Chitinophagales bacterium]|jgi:LruC domain-containing protein
MKILNINSKTLTFFSVLFFLSSITCNTYATPLSYQAPVDLGSASEFVILTQTGITNVSPSLIIGDVGTSPITGAALLLSCSEVVGNIFTVGAAGPAPCSINSPGLLTVAVGDMGSAYVDAAGRTLPDTNELGAGEIGGQTILAGLHKWSSPVSISSDVTLSGGPDDVWIFQIAGTLNLATYTNVILADGALAKNVFWQVADVVTIGTYGHFEGIVLAQTMVAVNTGASVRGRLFAQTAVTLQIANITEPTDTAPASAPLESCPTEAFLVQGSPAVMYAVDLSSGSYSTLAPTMSATSVVDAIAFSTHDQYIYGWDKARETAVRIGSDYQTEALAITGNLGGHYYVGDISTVDNAYYVYRKGSNDLHGLWRIELDSSSPEYLAAERIIDGSSLYVDIFDFAFHPDENTIYTVDNIGRLHTINPATGSRNLLGSTGVSGTFGAIYFDVSGNLYISSNEDGTIYKVDITSGDYTAELFAQGPSSSSNDGARCGFAAVAPLARTLLDFGDAPDTYSTSMATNGARHEVGGNIFLGTTVDGETQAYISPSSDDEVSSDDEDGVNFITSLSAGAEAIVNVETNDIGYLNAWIDFDKNGVFSSDEKVVDGQALAAGSHNIAYFVPGAAKQGATWSRFRYSSIESLNPTGGASDGEVEDHSINVNAQGVTQQYYPSVNGFVTIAFEDIWPSVGDYDMNDFVVNYRTSYSSIDGLVTAVSISGQITAIGAKFHNGFGVEVKGLARNNVDQSSIHYVINDIVQTEPPLEEGHNNAVFIVADDVWNYIEPAEGCSFYRTESNCGGSPVQFSFTIEAQLVSPVAPEEIELGLYNPFIFATNGYNRNSIFSSPPGRPLEIHLKNNTPTILADPALLARADDDSNAAAGVYYLTENGLPWALEIGAQWEHPGEYIDLILAYPDFPTFVQSNGTLNTDWYLTENADTTQLYKD